MTGQPTRATTTWLPWAPLDPYVEQMGGVRELARRAGVHPRGLHHAKTRGWVRTEVADVLATRGLGLVPYDRALWGQDWFDPRRGLAPRPRKAKAA